MRSNKNNESAIKNAESIVESPTKSETTKNSPIGESQNTEDKKSLDRCEEIIRQNERSGIIIGHNLMQINNQKL
jgi:hypothetical protein